MIIPIEHLYWRWHREWNSLGAFRVIQPPSVEQISISLARDHLRLVAYGSPEAHPDDSWVENVGIPAAREMVEAECGRAMAPTLFELSVNSFPGTGPGPWSDWRDPCGYGRPIVLPLAAPLIYVESVTYKDGDGDDQTMTEDVGYTVDASAEPAAIYPAYGTTWPTARRVPNSVRIRYWAGYSVGSPDEHPLPRRALAAMLLSLGHLYENREATTTERFMAELPLGVRNLLAGLNVNLGVA